MKLTILFLLISMFTFAQDSKVYELRIYHCHPDRLEALKTRFHDHTTRIFEKHGMENVGYWIPTAEGNNDLVYILGYPSMEARNESWKAFGSDPEWKKVAEESQIDGKIVASVESTFLKLEPELTKKIASKTISPDRLFELRTYYCFPDRFPNIVARFRDHTRKLFKNAGMTNIAYWSTIEKGEEQSKLVYIIAHKNEDAAKVSWDTFRADPKWIAAKTASEESGKIVEKVTSTYMKPLSFSKIK
ncbi:NIPSNAP protein [Spirosomataceae bacterium TFI 002]|nr:NIPSNAP protein [Spirosomataceae bacterium TFI 002]